MIFPHFVYITFLVLYLCAFQMRPLKSASLYTYFKHNYYCTATIWLHDLHEPDKSSVFYTCTRYSSISLDVNIVFFFLPTSGICIMLRTDPCHAASFSFKWSTVSQWMTRKISGKMYRRAQHKTRRPDCPAHSGGRNVANWGSMKKNQKYQNNNHHLAAYKVESLVDWLLQSHTWDRLWFVFVIINILQ